MSFTTATISALRSFAGVQALVGNGDSPETYRIYSLVLPQGVAMPAVVIERLNASEVQSLTDAGGAGLGNTRLRVSCYSSTLAEAQALSVQVRAAFKADTDLTEMHLMEFDGYEDDTQLYKTITDYSIWY